LWEHAARAALTNADWASAVKQASQAGELCQQSGDSRAAGPNVILLAPA
jgi:hypothetical protein